MYEYRANIIRVLDGDTVWADVDLGCDTHLHLTLRLEGVDAPERGTPEGMAATEYVQNWLHDHAGANGLVVIETQKDRREKYGRYLAGIHGWNESLSTTDRPGSGLADRCLNEMLVENGHARRYDGGARG